MRSVWIRVAGSCLTLLGTILPINAASGHSPLALPEPPKGVVGSASVDIWEEVLEELRLFCMMVGCTIGNSDQDWASAAVEEHGWAIVLAHAANGLRPDLSLAERAAGQKAVPQLLGLIDGTPNLVSDDLRPLLVRTIESIGEELAP